MRKEDFADIFGDIHENYIQEAETMKAKKPVWRRWAAVAACVCLLLAAAAAAHRFLPGTPTVPPADHETPVLDGPVREDPVPDPPVENTPVQPEDPEPAEKNRTQWMLHFNEALSVLSAERQMIKGYFTEALSDAELAALKPDADLICSGYAGFDQDGNLLDVKLTVSMSVPESPVSVAVTDYYFGPCYVLPGDELVSICGKVGYRAYQYELGGTITMEYQKDGTAATPDTSKTGSYDIVISGAAVPAGGNYNGTITFTSGTLTISAQPSSGGGDRTPPTYKVDSETTGETDGSVSLSTGSAKKGAAINYHLFHCLILSISSEKPIIPQVSR